MGEVLASYVCTPDLSGEPALTGADGLVLLTGTDRPMLNCASRTCDITSEIPIINLTQTFLSRFCNFFCKKCSYVMYYITGVNNSSDVQLKFRILPVILSDDRQCVVSWYTSS